MDKKPECILCSNTEDDCILYEIKEGLLCEECKMEALFCPICDKLMSDNDIAFVIERSGTGECLECRGIVE